MTSYGTIPTSSNPTPTANLEFISRAKERVKSEFATRRPWKLMVDHHSFSLPHGVYDVFTRIKTNLTFFRMNYVIIALVVIFFSLLWRPISLIVFSVMLAAWLFLYFLRDEPLVIFRRTIDDRTVAIALLVLTVSALILAGAVLNVVVSLIVGFALVALHAAVRMTDDLPLDEDSGRLFGG